MACWNFHLLRICFLGLGKDHEGQLLDVDWIEQRGMRIGMKNFLIPLLSMRKSSAPSGYSHKPVKKQKKFKIDKHWLDNEELRQVILEGWKSEDLPPEANIMEHIASCRKALSQWRRQNNVNSEKLVEKLKGKVEGLYSNDDATCEEISDALKELSTAL